MNKKRLIRIVSFAVVMMLFASMFTGCGSKEEASDETKASASKQEEHSGSTTKNAGEALYAEHLDLTWIVFNQAQYPGSLAMNSDTKKIIEEEFNVSITIPDIDVHNREQWTLYWAEGNTADHIISNSMVNFMVNFADQGIIRSISKEMLYKNMPEYMRKIEEVADMDLVDTQMTYNGSYWGVPYINLSNMVMFVVAVRQDWMNNLGITKTPETLDEMYELVYQFVYNNPNGTNGNDTLGINGQNEGFSYIFGEYDTYPHTWAVRDGEVIYHDTTDNYKEAMKVLQKWYNEGLIDPEFVTDNRDILRAKWAEGRIGVMPDHPWWFAPATSNNVTQMLTDKDPDAEIIFIKSPNKNNNAFAWYPYANNTAKYFGGKTSDEKVERIMAIYEYFASDYNYYMRFYWGVEGKDYNLDESGIPVPTEDANNPEYIMKNGLRQTFGLIANGIDWFWKEQPAENRPLYTIASEQNIISKGVLFSTTGTNVLAEEKREDIQSISEEFYYNAITGRIDIDAEWDGFIQRLNSAGLREVLDEYNKLLVK